MKTCNEHEWVESGNARKRQHKLNNTRELRTSRAGRPILEHGFNAVHDDAAEAAPAAAFALELLFSSAFELSVPAFALELSTLADAFARPRTMNQ